MRFQTALGLGLTIMFLAAGVSHGEAPKAGETVPVLETIVVTAGRVGEPKKETTTSITVIDEETIRQSTAQDVGDLLAEQGFAVRKYPGNLTSVGIRGFRTETHGNDLMGHVLILLNGRRAGTGNVAKIMTKNIQRVEIIRGPASVQYGSAAVGGIVNVITKQGEGAPSVFVEGSLGSWNYQDKSVGFSGAYQKFDFSGSYTHQTQGDYSTAKGDKYGNTGLGDLNNFSLNTGWSFGPKNRLGVILTGFDIKRQGSPSYFKTNDLDDYIDRFNQSVDLIYDGESPEGLLSWKTRYFQGEDKDRWVYPKGSNPDGYDSGSHSELGTNHQGAQAQMTFKKDFYRITAGIDWVNYGLKATWKPNKTNYANTAGFLLAKTSLLKERFIITGGLRYDTYQVKVQEPAGRTENGANTTPSFGLAYLPTEWLKLRVNYAQAFVMPAADQLAANYTYYGKRYVGNPGLKPEKSRTYEGGGDLFFGTFSTGFTYFHTEFDDKIQKTTPAAGTSSWANIGRATVSGLEGDLGWDIGAFLKWEWELRPYARFTYLTTFEDGQTKQDLLYTPNWTASYGLSVANRKLGLTANLNFSYSGDQKVEDWQSSLYPTPKVALAGYTVADLTVAQRLASWEKYGRLTLKGEIRNLLNADYESVKGFPMAGRSFLLGLRYDY